MAAFERLNTGGKDRRTSASHRFSRDSERRFLCLAGGLRLAIVAARFSEMEKRFIIIGESGASTACGNGSTRPYAAACEKRRVAMPSRALQ